MVSSHSNRTLTKRDEASCSHMNLRSLTLRSEREKGPEELVWTCVQDFHQHTALSLLGTYYWKAEIHGDQLQTQGTVERHSGKSLPECRRGLGRVVPAAPWSHWCVRNSRSSFTTLFLACWRCTGVCDSICNETLWGNGSEGVRQLASSLPWL